RAFPWQPGRTFAFYGLQLHRVSPRALFRACGAARAAYPAWAAAFDALTAGLLCHYALDRSVHPFVLYWQERLQAEEPGYARRHNFYHYRIESALDVLSLHRETGRFVKEFTLTSVLPRHREAEAPFGAFYAFLFARMFGVSVSEASASLAIRDMRQALWWMNDPRGCKQRYVLRPAETVLGLGHVATSLMRTSDRLDRDYGNEAHRPWCNPFTGAGESTASYADLFDRAVREAAELIEAYLTDPDTAARLTGDRGFASDVPGVYGELDRKKETGT
ncbi:MAG: hypothetical protein IKI63_06605, partial [Clostridia bacterium]|nr:hypothetical protein [Clostridia bacterium]